MGTFKILCITTLLCLVQCQGTRARYTLVRLGVSCMDANAHHTFIDFPSAAFALSTTPAYQLVNGSNWAGVVFTDNATTTGSAYVVSHDHWAPITEVHSVCSARGSSGTLRRDYTASFVSSIMPLPFQQSRLLEKYALCSARTMPNHYGHI